MEKKYYVICKEIHEELYTIVGEFDDINKADMCRSHIYSNDKFLITNVITSEQLSNNDYYVVER